MSQPKRYDIDLYGLPYEMDNGDFVHYSDYAALAAENERLRRAVDAMAERINADGQPHLETDDWDAAKSGN